MNLRLFITLVTAIVVGGICVYFIVQFLRHREEASSFPEAPRREIGFHADMERELPAPT